jgi:endonuclease/exonuclease/phosphatase family metal-dependent hydrolase
MKRLIVLTFAGLLFFSIFSTPVVAERGMVKVMTQNQYLGADLTPLVTAETPEEFFAEANVALQQIAANNFPVRVQRFAKQVALTKPDLIGLQEVYDFTLNGSNFGPPFVNHLDETISALAAKGQSYSVAATLNNLDITVSIDGLGVVRVLDRDVILAREGVEVTSLSGDFSNGGLCGVPIPNPAFPAFGPELLVSTESEEGCNFTTFLEIPSPLGSAIKIERGFVGVDAVVRGKTYRFVNTHFEQKLPDPNNPGSAIFQSLQAAELVGTLIATTPPDMNLVLLGDFNSWSEDAPIAGITPPYQIIIGAGFADVWDTNPLARFDQGGLTCCEFSDLSNVTSDRYERVDIIFVKDTLFLPLSFVTGKIPIFPLSEPPNWASDHGGVFGKLIFKGDRME